MAYPPNREHPQGQQRRRALGVLLAGSLLGLVACGRIERTRECQALVATVNPALDGIEARQASGAGQRAVLMEAARRYENLAAQVTRLHFTDDQLGRTVQEYADLLRRAARAARGVAAMLDQGNVAAIQRAKAELDSVARKEKALAKRLDQICQNP